MAERKFLQPKGSIRNFFSMKTPSASRCNRDTFPHHKTLTHSIYGRNRNHCIDEFRKKASRCQRQFRSFGDTPQPYLLIPHIM